MATTVTGPKASPRKQTTEKSLAAPRTDAETAPENRKARLRRVSEPFAGGSFFYSLSPRLDAGCVSEDAFAGIRGRPPSLPGLRAWVCLAAGRSVARTRFGRAVVRLGEFPRRT